VNELDTRRQAIEAEIAELETHAPAESVTLLATHPSLAEVEKEVEGKVEANKIQTRDEINAMGLGVGGNGLNDSERNTLQQRIHSLEDEVQSLRLQVLAPAPGNSAIRGGNAPVTAGMGAAAFGNDSVGNTKPPTEDESAKISDKLREMTAELAALTPEIETAQTSAKELDAEKTSAKAFIKKWVKDFETVRGCMS
jgi:chromosome segregation ATPase